MKRTAYTFYYLQHPTTAEIGYVGMTNEPLVKRLSRHIYEAIRREHSPESNKNVWLRSMLDEGVRPQIVQLEHSAFPDAAKAGEREKYWIATMREKGNDLRNMTDGGLGAPGFSQELTEETRQKIAESKTTYDTDEIVAKGLALRKEGKSWKAIYEELGMAKSNFTKIYQPKIQALL